MSDNDNQQNLQSYARRLFLQRSTALAGMIALGGGSYLLNPKGAWAADPIKVGIATDLTGALGYAGIPNANVAKMVVEEINAAGGLLGRPLQLFLEDTASLVGLEQVEGKHKEAIASLLTLKFQTFDNPQLLAA